MPAATANRTKARAPAGVNDRRTAPARLEPADGLWAPGPQPEDWAAEAPVRPDDPVLVSSLESFPASDPPAWVGVRAGPSAHLHRSSRGVMAPAAAGREGGEAGTGNRRPGATHVARWATAGRAAEPGREAAGAGAAGLNAPRRGHGCRRKVLVVDDYLLIDLDHHQVWAGGRRVPLTPTEYRLLYHLATNPGRLMPFAELLASVWGEGHQDDEHYVRLYVSYLREKIEPDPTRPRYILADRGRGYRFVDYRRGRGQAEAAGRHEAGGRPANAGDPLPAPVAARLMPALAMQSVFLAS
jgi:DNA-binding winged helix-turn-helix (wHTH) protein